MSSRARYSVAFVGPIAVRGQNPRGGYQACNQRTISALLSRNVEVKALCYPEPYGSVFNKGISYLLGFVRLFWRLLWSREQIVHITGLYKHFIYPELLLVVLAGMKGCRVVYDIRAGAARKHYDQKTPLYRWAFRETLRRATTVMVEGAEYIEFVHNLVGKSAYLLPNHVSLSETAEVQRPAVGRTSCEVALVYAGRLVSNKGIETVLQTAEILRHRGQRVRLHIAGEGEQPYVSMLKERYGDADNVWLGSISSTEVMSLFSASNFFLFPTTHPGEGHSNALTEAMAAGCVPLASLNGFNQSVIGDCGRVLPLSADAPAYADAVLEVVRTDQWDGISAAATRRARECFETSLVVASLVEYYEKLGELKCQ